MTVNLGKTRRWAGRPGAVERAAAKLKERAPAIIAPDAEVLRWAGAIGHTFALIISTRGASITDRRCVLETCDRKSAIAAAMGDYANASPAVYQQIAPGRWKPVKLPKRTMPLS